MPVSRRRVVVILILAVIACAVATLAAAPPSGAQGCSTGSGNSCGAPHGGTGASSLIGTVAPSTVGPDLTGTGTIDLASLLTRPTAMVFWLHTCPHCRAALPAVQKLSTRLGTDRQVVTGAIDIPAKGPKGFETPAAAVHTLGLRMPTILVPNDVAQTEWKVASTPTAFILDSTGAIRRVIVPANPKQLASEIAKALQKVD